MLVRLNPTQRAICIEALEALEALEAVSDPPQIDALLVSFSETAGPRIQMSEAQRRLLIAALGYTFVPEVVEPLIALISKPPVLH